MTVIDLFSRQPVTIRRTPAELATLARAAEVPEFVKRRGLMVLTDETRDSTVELFEAFGLRLDSATAETRLNTWAWLGSTVATALFAVERGDFDSRVRLSQPEAFCAYVLAVANGDTAEIETTARELGVLNGMEDGHPLLAELQL